MAGVGYGLMITLFCQERPVTNLCDYGRAGSSRVQESIGIFDVVSGYEHQTVAQYYRKNQI